ncbi:MAG: bifunctional (p)ppGpp synthetase/guanosine-3',5'-bis(diphosphate) 3'-pyrophosphohydrolase, partial [Betaproteobacteria bacterium]|nr:bifunctional (p)ppGpp synthetase/guanosine-3',5'-bis(diphosphate) 3'-pyrophosphohydrolase [Betaproteobacteria bacterium]
MLLAMVEDIRVVMLRLASRTQTLRYYAAVPDDLRVQVARETLELYSPLANRLGVWELKWELEDLSFRFLHPDTYKKIAKMLDEKRLEREQFIIDAVARVREELAQVGITNAEIYGRPKHIYSIWNKMRKKGVDFSEVYDVRALRVIVDEVKDCYTVLGIVHNIWTPIPKEFDDYISNPKGNYYRSLHTAVRCPDGRSLEVQIRTWDMHKHAELGVAAHWRYKEGTKHSAEDNYDDKIAWLRQLLTWKDEVSDSSDWVNHYKQAALDETVYVMTPQGKVLDLPQGATPVDFAYRLHTDLGHRCRGAKVDGVLVPLDTALKTGQRVEIIAAKQGGPSRDWLNPALGYIATKTARTKARAWFSSLALEETLAEGRAILTKELQRQGGTHSNMDELAA